MAGERARAFRLPAHVRPVRYLIELELDPQRSRRYRGQVRIELALGRACDVIELHAADLRVRGARIEADGESQRARIEALPEHEVLRIVPRTPLLKGKAVLELKFSGTLRGDLRGLYFATSGKRRYAFSQLEAADARRFFPCFDEPSFKARFELVVTTSVEHAVISNSPVQARRRLPGGQQRVAFAPTPKL